MSNFLPYCLPLLVISCISVHSAPQQLGGFPAFPTAFPFPNPFQPKGQGESGPMEQLDANRNGQAHGWDKSMQGAGYQGIKAMQNFMENMQQPHQAGNPFSQFSKFNGFPKNPMEDGGEEKKTSKGGHDRSPESMD